MRHHEYVRFTIIHFQDGGDQIDEDFGQREQADLCYRVRKATQGVCSVQLFGWLDTGEPHLLAEWDRDEQPKKRRPDRATMAQSKIVKVVNPQP